MRCGQLTHSARYCVRVTPRSTVHMSPFEMLNGRYCQMIIVVAVLVVVIVVKVCVGVLKVLMVNLYSQCTMIVMCDV